MADTDKPTPGSTKPEPTVRLAVGHPVDVWNHGIDGVDPITADGTDVPAGKEQAIRDAAKDADVKIRKAN